MWPAIRDDGITVPVLVVGGGPVGLAMSLFAARMGVATYLVERRHGHSTLPRSTHLSRRTMELFGQAGLAGAVARRGFEVVPRGDPRARRDPAATLPRTVLGLTSLAVVGKAEVLETGEEELAVPGPYPPYWCGQDRIEPLLAEAASRHGAQLAFGHEMVDLQVGEDGVEAQVRGPHGTYPVRARYLVGADGGQSQVRARVGIGTRGLGVVGHRISIIFRADLERVLRGRRFFMSMIEGPQFSGAIMQLNDPQRWAAAIGYDPDRGESATDFTLDRCRSLLQYAIGDPSVPIEVEATFNWQAQHRMAESYRSGQVFLVGDAAHLHPPSGGYGSNVGYQDAHNLAWKLAGVLQGWAGEARLLDTYDAERRPVAEATAEQALLLDGHGDRLPGIVACDPRNLVMGYRYPRSSIALGDAEDGPMHGPFRLCGEPGTRVPDIAGFLPDGTVTSTVLQCAERFTLLTGHPGWRAAARTVGDRLGVPLRGMVVGSGPEADLRERAPGGFAATCGVTARGAVLVRPDGFVAWRTAAGPSMFATTVNRMSALLCDVLGRESMVP